MAVGGATGTAGAPPPARIIGAGPVLLWGITSAERLRRSLARAGVREVAPEQGGDPAGPVILVRADWVFDDVLIQRLVKQPGTLLVADSGQAVAAHATAGQAGEALQALTTGAAAARTGAAALRRVNSAELAGAYDQALRKRQPPYLLRLTEAGLPAIERRMFAGSYKGVTDLVTKYVWPRPAQMVTKWCAVAGITPNQVTAVSLLLVFAAFALFWKGYFWWGLAAAWPMTFLDTVDGKLARVTLTSSKFGNIFDHGIDLIHPPFWWWAWMVGLAHVGMPLAQFDLVLAVIAGGYVLQRIGEAVFITAFGMQMHIWRRFDSRFRLITARRNPNLILLTVAMIFGRPDLGILAVAVWTALSLAVHAAQIVQGWFARRRGPLESWLSQ
ncbi:phosphatidylglycerophosphate synthase [Stella humosa]|uniref:Phosphatidylglycerophosphate synthase n=1 Tax=Stella humosa TaxID=94 RepID=A0A3N1MC89_9PROT|nr:CDP-alcohol phosphatidyltransferase family protein [Stella humosa]ROQ00327.1 phosphatidylglycerophosphate synthase [Stella humosa]BBK30434.1 hypothetical protein STHU_10680 [Stella humosa]